MLLNLQTLNKMHHSIIILLLLSSLSVHGAPQPGPPSKSRPASRDLLSPQNSASKLRKRNQASSDPQLLCPDPGTPPNGRRELLQSTSAAVGLFAVGARVSYDCNSGYFLRGSSVLSCVLDEEEGLAEWDAETPQCLSK